MWCPISFMMTWSDWGLSRNVLLKRKITESLRKASFPSMMKNYIILRLCSLHLILLISHQPLFGLIQHHLQLATHAYFLEKNFTKTQILVVSYHSSGSVWLEGSVCGHIRYNSSVSVRRWIAMSQCIAFRLSFVVTGFFRWEAKISKCLLGCTSQHSVALLFTQQTKNLVRRFSHYEWSIFSSCRRHHINLLRSNRKSETRIQCCVLFVIPWIFDGIRSIRFRKNGCLL